MTTDAKRFEVRSPEGTLMFSVHLLDESPTPNGGQRPNSKGASNSGTESQRHQESNEEKDSPFMTEAQRRYLFRILAERGVDGDAAHQQLRELFGVETLNSVGKREASSMIKRLLDEAEAK